jgi:hypothetical protein
MYTKAAPLRRCEPVRQGVALPGERRAAPIYWAAHRVDGRPHVEARLSFEKVLYVKCRATYAPA